MDESKKLYHSSFQSLRETKSEIERVQRVFEAGTLRLHSDFESWYSNCLLRARMPVPGVAPVGAAPAMGAPVAPAHHSYTAAAAGTALASYPGSTGVSAAAGTLPRIAQAPMYASMVSPVAVAGMGGGGVGASGGVSATAALQALGSSGFAFGGGHTPLAPPSSIARPAGVPAALPAVGAAPTITGNRYGASCCGLRL